MAAFLKIDGKCVGCARGAEDVQMQICIDSPPQAPRGGDGFLNWSSPPPCETLYRRDPAGWMTSQGSDGGAAWVDAPLLVPPVVISHMICYYSSLGVICRQCCAVSFCRFAKKTAMSESVIAGASWHFGKHKKKTGKYVQLPGEESTRRLSHLIWEENVCEMTVVAPSQSHRWRRLVAFITSTAERMTVWGSQRCHDRRTTRLDETFWIWDAPL